MMGRAWHRNTAAGLFFSIASLSSSYEKVLPASFFRCTTLAAHRHMPTCKRKHMVLQI